MNLPPKTYPKPWGHEIWFAHNEKYAGKILFIKKGHRYSLQYHERKTETQYLYRGKLKITLGENQNTLSEKILLPGDKVEILPYTDHRAEAQENSEIFEVSTPELDDVIKLQDDYGRSGKGNNEKLDQLLARDEKSFPVH